MKTTLMARGPDFKCDYKTDAMRNVDTYLLLCHLLSLDTCHEGRGQLANTLPLLSNEQCVPVPTPAPATGKSLRY